MKINLRKKAKSALSILLTLCMIFSVLTVGIVSTSAAEVDVAKTGAHNPVKGGALIVYAPNWSDVSLIAGGSWGYQNNFTKGFHGSKISGTDFFAVTLGNVGNDDAGTAGGWILVDGNYTSDYSGTSQWYETEAASFSNRTGSQTYGFNNNSNYLAVVSGTGSSCSVTTTAAAGGSDYSKTIADNTNYKKTQTVKVQYKNIGDSSYTLKSSSDSTTGGSVKLTGKQWDTAWNATKDASSTASNYSSALSDAVVTSYAKLEQTPVTGYTFDGWFSAQSGGTQYTPSTGYKVSTAATTYARYHETANTVTFKEKLGDSAVTTLASQSAGVKTSTSYTAPTHKGYTFTGWTITSGSANAINASATSDPSVTSFSLNAKGAVTVQANYNKVTLTKPSLSINKSVANAGEAITLTVDNHSDIAAQDSNVTYDLFKNNSKITSGFTYNNGVFTFSSVTTNDSGDYTVIARSHDENYFDSSESDEVSLTVYSPQFCLVGNDIRDDAFLINDVTPSKTQPVEGKNWFNTWQESFAVNTPTATPGVYSLTFQVKEDYAWAPDIEIYTKEDNSQKAFILNGEAYNTSARGDITVTDNGILWSGNLFAYDLAASNPGGALLLKKGQTYTITIDQTKRYNDSSSNPYGKIQIEAADWYADTVAKKMAYNPTGRDWEAVSDASSTIGTVSSTPLHDAKPSFNTVLTATVANANYDFIGFYTDAACTQGEIPASACTSSGSTYTKEVSITSSVTYYALFKQKQPTDVAITVVQPSSSDGSFVIKSGAAANNTQSNTTAYPGATVSLEATPYKAAGAAESAKEFAYWRIINSDTARDVTSMVMNNTISATSSFVMPSYPVTITAVFRDRTVVKVTASTNNADLGTAAYTSGTYYIGSSVPITATPTPQGQGVFVRWQVTGGTVANATNASTTVTPTAANVTVKAIFDYKSYQLYFGTTKYVMLRQSDGTYVSTKPVTGTTSFTIYDVAENKYARSRTSTGDYELNTGGYTSHYFQTTWSSSSTANYKYKLHSNISSNSYYVVFNPASGTYGGISIVADNPLGTIAQIYAKDGAIRYESNNSSSGNLWDYDKGGTTCNRGVTTVTKIDGTAIPNPDTSRYPSTGLSDHLKIYSAPIDSTITIETSINDTYEEQGFYVGMFVINGWKVAATDKGNGIYSADFSLSSEYAVDNLSSQDSFEITPVYYNKNFEYITFYVDADSVPEEWGNTISVCANYSGATYPHFEGTYPGQPLGREGDLYEIKVSKYYYDYNSTTKVWTRHSNFPPAATITAFNYDNVHHYYYVNASEDMNGSTTNHNYQTYDYSDFASLAVIHNIEAIQFRCMPESAKTNRDACVGVSATRPADSSVNTYHLLTDYYGNPIDALGNRIPKTGDGYYTAEDAASLTVANAAIKIVSCGNISNDNKKSDSAQDVAYKNWRTVGNWITAWKVFDATAATAGTHIAVGSPADFINIDANTENQPHYNFSYATGKSASDLSGKITYISYEKELTNDKNLSGVDTDTGERIDGQWYYSAMSDFYSNVQVATTTADTSAAVAGGNTTIETDTNSANNTGFIGGTSGTKATLDGETTHLYTNVTTDAELKVNVGSGYTFVGWYIKDGTKYTKIGDNFSDLNTTMTMKKNYTIVAVVKKIPAGSLVLTHSRYTGSSPEPHTGTGKYYISAKVYTKSGDTFTEDTTKSQPETLNAITIPGLAANDYLEITLRTVCDGDDTFYAWYEEALGDGYTRTDKYYEICDENEDPIDQKEVSYTFFKGSCAKFFDGNILTRQSLDFYSDITHVSAFADITYKYFDRFNRNGDGQMASYSVKQIELSAEEIENGYIPTDEKIERYAPKVIDTIYKDTKWVITDVDNKVQRLKSNITVMATQTDKDCYVQYVPFDDVENQIIGDNDTVPVNEVAEWTNTSAYYNSLILKPDAAPNTQNEEDFVVSAPKTIVKNDTTFNFVRFDVYRIKSRISHELGEVMFSCNTNTFGYRIFADCVIYPVYSTGTVARTLTATIEPAVLNREVFGTNTSLTDRLYADLVVAYMNTSAVDGSIPDVIRENDPSHSGYSIETGVLVDRAKILSDDDYNYLSHQAESGLDDVTQDILLNYEGGYTGNFTNETATTTIETLLNGSGTSNTYTYDSKSHTVNKYANNNADLTNMNRLDKVLRFSNSEAARKYIFAAYSYVIVTNVSTEAKTIKISDPQYFNFCYTGSKPIDTTV